MLFLPGSFAWGTWLLIIRSWIWSWHLCSWAWYTSFCDSNATFSCWMAWISLSRLCRSSLSNATNAYFSLMACWWGWHSSSFVNSGAQFDCHGLWWLVDVLPSFGLQVAVESVGTSDYNNAFWSFLLLAVDLKIQARTPPSSLM